MTAAALEPDSSGPIIGYRFTACCYRCGAPLRHVANGVPQETTTAVQVRAVAECTACGFEHLIAVTMHLHSKRPIAVRRRSPRKVPK